MFNKLKQFKDLRDQAKNLQNILAQEKVEVDLDGIKLVMNGNQEVVSLILPDDISKDELENKIPQAFNKAIEKVKRLMVEKMQAGNITLPNF